MQHDPDDPAIGQAAEATIKALQKRVRWLRRCVLLLVFAVPIGYFVLTPVETHCRFSEPKEGTPPRDPALLQLDLIAANADCNALRARSERDEVYIGWLERNLRQAGNERGGLEVWRMLARRKIDLLDGGVWFTPEAQTTKALRVRTEVHGPRGRE